MYVSSKRAAELSQYAQDYIGQLARSGQIEATRVGGLWYVLMDSLNSYQASPEVGKTLIHKERSPSSEDSNVLVSFDGKDYISASRASKLTGYNQDYIGQLARTGKVLARQVGNRWYIDREGIQVHKREKDALLAAVQASSVGVPSHEIVSDTFAELPKSEDTPLLTYTLDHSDLTPVIEKSESHVFERAAQNVGSQYPENPPESNVSYRNDRKYYQNMLSHSESSQIL